MTFHCVAEGNPGPQYLWTRGRQDSLVQVVITMLIVIQAIFIKERLLYYAHDHCHLCNVAIFIVIPIVITKDLFPYYDDHCLHDHCHQCVNFHFCFQYLTDWKCPNYIVALRNVTFNLNLWQAGKQNLSLVASEKTEAVYRCQVLDDDEEEDADGIVLIKMVM